MAPFDALGICRMLVDVGARELFRLDISLGAFK